MPRLNKRRDFEAKITPKIERWLKYYGRRVSPTKNLGPIEVKVSYDRRFNINSNVGGKRIHQLKALVAIEEEKVVVYKIPDEDRRRKPWDIDCYTNSKPAYALMWHRTGNKVFYLINPLYFKILLDRKATSITEEEAAENCIMICHLRT